MHVHGCLLVLFANYWCEIESPLTKSQEHPKPLKFRYHISDMGKTFSYSYDGTDRGEAIVNKDMYIYNKVAKALTDLVKKFDRWHGTLQKGN